MAQGNLNLIHLDQVVAIRRNPRKNDYLQDERMASTREGSSQISMDWFSDGRQAFNLLFLHYVILP